MSSEPTTEAGKELLAQLIRGEPTSGRTLIIAIEREAAHPSGAGSGLPFVGEVIFAAHVVTGDDPIPAGWNLVGRASSLLTVSRDGEVAAIAAALGEAWPKHWDGAHRQITASLDGRRLATRLYDAGLRVAPSASGDSLDVETLARAYATVATKYDAQRRVESQRVFGHTGAAIPGTTGMHHWSEVAAEYARLRSEEPEGRDRLLSQRDATVRP